MLMRTGASRRLKTSMSKPVTKMRKLARIPDVTTAKTSIQRANTTSHPSATSNSARVIRTRLEIVECAAVAKTRLIGR